MTGDRWLLAEPLSRPAHRWLPPQIRVYCRVRPHPSPSTRIAPDGGSIALQADGKDHTFAYDRVFGPDSSQESVFSAVSELVQSALDGFHVCIFSYGQTGAGKTHTMQGGESPNARGIIPRAVEKVRPVCPAVALPVHKALAQSPVGGMYTSTRPWPRL